MAFGVISVTEIAQTFNQAGIPLTPANNLSFSSIPGIYVTFFAADPTVTPGGAGAKQYCLVISPRWQTENTLLLKLLELQLPIAFNLQDAVLHYYVCVIGALRDFDPPFDDESEAANKLRSLIDAVRQLRNEGTANEVVTIEPEGDLSNPATLASFLEDLNETLGR